jgi:cytoskeleton protein RodZ
MSDAAVSMPQAAENASAPSTHSCGPRLAAAREAMGLSVKDLAARLRLNPRQVIAIENENFSALPGAAFVRGFVRNYAKEVRLDPEPLIDALNRTLEPSSAQSMGGAQGSSPVMNTGEGARLSRPLVLAAALVALAVFAVAGWMTTSRRQPPSAVKAPPAASAPAVVAPKSASSSATAQTPPPAVATPPDGSTPGSQPAGTTAGTELTPAPTAIAASPEPNALRFSFRENSWVEVAQHDGTVLMSQNNLPGTEQTVAGKPPYQVVIGNASAVSLEFGGKPIDLKSATSFGNVARLTLP